MGFSRKNLKPPIEDINGNFQRDRVKVVGIPGGMSKFEGKTRISRGVNAKKWKILGGQLQKKNDILNREVQFFSGKAQCCIFRFQILSQ